MSSDMPNFSSSVCESALNLTDLVISAAVNTVVSCFVLITISFFLALILMIKGTSKKALAERALSQLRQLWTNSGPTGSVPSETPTTRRRVTQLNTLPKRSPGRPRKNTTAADSPNSSSSAQSQQLVLDGLPQTISTPSPQIPSSAMDGKSVFHDTMTNYLDERRPNYSNQ